MSSKERPEDQVARSAVIQALQKTRGKVTLGDVCGATGLSMAQAEVTLNELLLQFQGHLEVTSEGQLIYNFNPKLVKRDSVSVLKLILNALAIAGKWLFKVAIFIVLIGYFVIFLVLAIASILALLSGGKNNKSRSSSSKDSGGQLVALVFRLVINIFSHVEFNGKSESRSRGNGEGRSRGNGEKRSSSNQDTPPFYQKIFSFVFGPEEPKADPLAKRQRWASIIRQHSGVLTAYDVMKYQGCSLRDAEEQLASTLGLYGGEAKVTNDGNIYYVFEDISKTAQDAEKSNKLKPAWKNFIPKPLHNTNTTGTNVLISFFNGFNLLFSFIIFSDVFPEFTELAAEFFGPYTTDILGLIPFAFSSIFFLIPLIRFIAINATDEKRRKQNLRIALLNPISKSLKAATKSWLSNHPAKPLNFNQACKSAVELLPCDNAKPNQKQVTSLCRHILSEYDAEPVGDIDSPEFHFESLKAAQLEVEAKREAIEKQATQLGEVVYTTDENED